MLKKITIEESVGDRSTAELDALKNRDWVSQNKCGHSLTGGAIHECDGQRKMMVLRSAL